MSNNNQTREELLMELYMSAIKYVLALVSYTLTAIKAFQNNTFPGEVPGIISLFFSFSIFNDAVGMLQALKKEEYSKGKRKRYYTLSVIYFDLSIVGMVFNWVCFQAELNNLPCVVISMIFAAVYFFKLSVMIMFTQKKLKRM